MTYLSPRDKTKFASVLLSLALINGGRAEPEIDARELPRTLPTAPQDALGTFEIVPGYRLELAAAEPLVADPIAMAFDGGQRLFVVEMRGYSERRDEKLGRIRLLLDDDGDGRFDRSTVYAEGLAWPTAVIAWRDGIFVAATPDILYFEDGDGDGVAETSRRLFTGFGAGVDRLNVQALVNSFTWGHGGRIHGATAGNGGRVRRADQEGGEITELRGVDFSFDPETLDLRAENGGGQYGLCFDRAGRKFVCSNSNHIQQVMYPRRYAGSPLPPARLGIAVDGPAAEVYRLSADEPWRVVRTRWRVAGKVKGPIEGGGRVSGYFTAATGICIHDGDAFVCDAGSNLVHHKSLAAVAGAVPLQALRPDGERDREFLASTDNWFRPVQAISGPDGALYIADMYREVIEHPWSLPASIKRHLDLNRGNDRGRIYRIVPADHKQAAPVNYAALKPAQLIARLDQSDHEQALRALYERRPAGTVPALRTYLDRRGTSRGHGAALQLLADLDGLDEAQLLVALSSPAQDQRRRAIALSESFEPLPDSVRAKLVELARDPAPEIRFQLALTLGLRTGDWRVPLLAEILASPGDDWIRAAALKALGNSAGTAFASLAGLDPPAPSKQLLALAAMVGESGSDADAARVRRFAAERGDDRFQFLAALASSGRLEFLPAGLADAALSTACNPEVAHAERAAAIRLVGRLLSDEPAELRQLLSVAKAPAILDAVAEALQRWDRAESGTIVIARWEAFSPAGRIHALNAMLGAARAPLLLAAIRDGKIQRHAIDGANLERLLNHPSPDTRSLAASVFADKLSVDQRIAHFSESLELAGDATRGREIFLSRCSTCHRAADGAGFAYGPDLSSFKSAGKESILNNLIAPSREVAPQFAANELELKDGRKVSGRIIAQTENEIRLALPAGLELTVARDELATSTKLQQSPMPERLESGLSQQEMADLLEFLSSGD